MFRWQEREQRHPVKKPTFQARSFDAYKDHRKPKFHQEKRAIDRRESNSTSKPKMDSMKPKGTTF